MRIKEMNGAKRLVAVALVLGAAAAVLGGGVLLSQEEEDPCTGQDNVTNAYCQAYCVALDCVDNPSEDCLLVFDRYVDLTGEAPPCEAAEEE